LDLVLFGKKNTRDVLLGDVNELTSVPSNPTVDRAKIDMKSLGAPEEVIDLILDYTRETRQLKRMVQAEAATNNSTIPADTCDPSSVFVQYNYTTYTCNGTVVTQQQYDILSKNSSCYTNESLAYTCICPLDMVGENCKGIRKFTCETIMVSPVLNCTNPNTTVGGIALSGDFPCITVKSTDELPFSFLMNCTYTEDADFSTTNAKLNDNSTVLVVSNKQYVTVGYIRSNFTYYYKSDEIENPQFVLRTGPLSSNFTLRFYNFNRLSDKRGIYGLKVTDGDAYVARKTIEFHNFRPSDLSDEFFAGQRLYGEAGYPPNEVAGLVLSFRRILIDFTDRVPPEYTDYSTVIIGVVAPIGSIIVLAIFATVVGICYYKKMNEKNFMKVE